jgi:hypothetical protein
MSTEEILKHMEQRYMTENTDIQPDAATYNAVLHRLGEIKDHDAADRAENLRRMEGEQQKMETARPNAIS